MKRSELTMTGETYRLTPANWGETYIMVDEDAVSKMMSETFGEECDPDDDPNNKPETVEIATDGQGNFYAILEPYEATSWGRKTGEVFNENMFRKCQNPAETGDDGTAEIYGQTWDIFDDEDDAE